MTRRLARIAPGARLVVTGCAASAAPGDFRLPSLAALVPQTARVRLLKIDPHELLERAEPLILPEESLSLIHILLISIVPETYAGLDGDMPFRDEAL